MQQQARNYDIGRYYSGYHARPLRRLRKGRPCEAMSPLGRRWRRNDRCENRLAKRKLVLVAVDHYNDIDDIDWGFVYALPEEEDDTVSLTPVGAMTAEQIEAECEGRIFFAIDHEQASPGERARLEASLQAERDRIEDDYDNFTATAAEDEVGYNPCGCSPAAIAICQKAQAEAGTRTFVVGPTGCPRPNRAPARKKHLRNQRHARWNGVLTFHAE